jgi:hypothetical protein
MNHRLRRLHSAARAATESHLMTAAMNLNYGPSGKVFSVYLCVSVPS